MATFYPSLDDQKLASFPESLLHSGNMMMYLNHASSAGLYSDDSLENHPVGDRNEMMFIPPTRDGTSYGLLNTSAGDPVDNPVTGNPQVAPRTQLDILDGEQNFQSQRLSLCLGTHMSSSASAPSFHYQYMNPSFASSLSTHIPTSGEKTEFCGPTNFSETILNSKYLKETQQLLHEIVNVQKAMKRVNSSKHHGIGLDASKEPDWRSNSQSTFPTTNETLSDATESNTNTSPELSPMDRQDLQNKKAKLISMLDEVDRRYKQYYHQMQIVVSSFNSISGCGAAKPYTTLARETISRHFRCLRDAISGQIQVIRRRLGEQETGIPRLRSVDHQIRQQRALQQLGVTRHAWRPQRGLPESSVLTLRAWLFEHFLHPYPSDSEKIMLARQAGLTRNQVANWFINARVRLWKPMVEEMHNEEFGESDMNSKSIEDASKVPRDYCSASEDGGELQDSTTSTAVDVDSMPGQVQNLKSDHISSVEINGSTIRMAFQSGFHKDTVMHSGVIQLQDDHRPAAVDGHSLLNAATNDMSQLNGFEIGGQVSLALGLHHQESDVYSMPSGTHIRGSDTMSSFVEPGTMDYHCMDTGKQQLRFGSPHQLHDFIVGKNTCL